MSPARQQAEVFAVARSGRFTVLTLVAPGITHGARPGQVVSIGLPAPFTVRRSFWLHAATPGAQFAGSARIVIDPVGPGRQWLARRAVGDTLDVIGPVGTWFPIPSVPVPAVLVGWGHSTAPLLDLAERLVEAGGEVEALLGGPDPDAVYGELAAKRVVGRVQVGVGPDPAALARPVAAAVRRSGAQVLYAAGPSALLHAVDDVAREHVIPAQVALETPQPCGIGVCGLCAVALRDRTVLGCLQGPVLPSDRLADDVDGRT